MAGSRAGVTPTIALLGDVMLGRAVAERLAEVPPEEVWAPEVRELCRSCDLVICNLECCISARGEPTERVRQSRSSSAARPRRCDRSRRSASGRSASPTTTRSTTRPRRWSRRSSCSARPGSPSPGRAAASPQARRGAIVEAGGRRLGLVAVSDHPREFAAGRDSPGIAYGDLRRGIPDWLAGELARLDRECDHVVAFPHWGPNMTTEPASWQRRAAAELQEAGADLVAGHSAHVFHGAGWGRRGPLLYDLGDALDDYAVDPSAAKRPGRAGDLAARRSRGRAGAGRACPRLLPHPARRGPRRGMDRAAAGPGVRAARDPRGANRGAALSGRARRAVAHSLTTRMVRRLRSTAPLTQPPCSTTSRM